MLGHNLSQNMTYRPILTRQVGACVRACVRCFVDLFVWLLYLFDFFDIRLLITLFIFQTFHIIDWHNTQTYYSASSLTKKTTLLLPNTDHLQPIKESVMLLRNIIIIKCNDYRIKVKS